MAPFPHKAAKAFCLRALVASVAQKEQTSSCLCPLPTKPTLLVELGTQLLHWSTWGPSLKFDRAG
jgi:hypothetical protein